MPWWNILFIKTREDAKKIKVGDTLLIHPGKFRINVIEILNIDTDIVFRGVVISSDHEYDILKDEIILWGPKCMARTTYGYLNNIRISKK
jgi:hypothetical protein